eukprot:818451-Pyramimonas_sp.AAC.2
MSILVLPNTTSFYGSSCAINGEGAHNTPDLQDLRGADAGGRAAAGLPGPSDGPASAVHQDGDAALPRGGGGGGEGVETPLQPPGGGAECCVGAAGSARAQQRLFGRGRGR